MANTTAVRPAKQSVTPFPLPKFLKPRALVGYGFILPGLILYVVFIVYPFIEMLRLSLYQSRGLVPRIEYVGFANYEQVFNDSRFWSAFGNNVLWSLATLVVPMVLGFIIAVVLARSNIIGRNFFRVVFFIPVTFSQVVVATVFTWIYHPRWGLANTVLTAIGLEHLTTAWLGDPDTALWALIIAGIWREIGLFMVVFLAGMQKIPSELFDAAKVDGANPLEEILYVIIPSLRQEVTFMVVTSIIISFKVFDIVQVLTRGGPFGRTEVLGFYVFELGFNQFNWGYGNTVAVVLTLIIFAISGITVFARARTRD